MHFAAILGTPERVLEKMQAYAAAGAEEMMIQWFNLDDIEGIAMIAESRQTQAGRDPHILCRDGTSEMRSRHSVVYSIQAPR